jgi:hypothetical protein
MQEAGLDAVKWTDVATSLIERGWVRLEGVAQGHTCAQLIEAAPGTWAPLPDVVMDVRQGGLSTGVFFDRAAASVQEFGRAVCDSLTKAGSDVPAVPCFNEVRWGRSQDGIGYITAHRDPPGAGGVIATVTLWGEAVFRVWHGPQATEWETADGDLVILRGNGWPSEGSLCPVHEVESPHVGDRMTMTLRHNRRGPGGDYFA